MVTEYIGGGYLAELFAELDAAERRERQLEYEAWQAFKAEQNAIDDEVDSVGAQMQAVVDAAFLVAGYHQRKRVWRKQRGRNNQE